jgi:hypothetical protein
MVKRIYSDKSYFSIILAPKVGAVEQAKMAKNGGWQMRGRNRF